jgi:hypothetical protein
MAALSGVLLLSIAFALLQLVTGVQVTVRNSGAATIHSVILYVTGGSFPVGDLTPGNSATTTVRPQGDSHVEIGYSDSDGEPVRLSVDCYVERGHTGTIDVSIKNRRIDEQHVNVGTGY